MRIVIATLLAACALSLQAPIQAQEKAADKGHLKELIEQHKAIAAAHQAAAQCLAEGKKEEACHEQLSKACRGLPTIGKLCGMSKHRH